MSKLDNEFQSENAVNTGEEIAFLAVSLIKGVGYWKLHKLALENEKFLRLLKHGAASDFERKLALKITLEKNQAWESYRDELWESACDLYNKMKLDDIKLIFFRYESFPELLRKIPDPPLWLFVQGNASLLKKEIVTIVGTRRPDGDGVFLAKYVIALLSSFHFVTVSGLADGIDKNVHIESLNYRLPTIAVLGNGLYKEFPKGSNELKDKILLNNGAIVSEYLPFQNYSAENFVRRNRIQAGLSRVTIPVQWNIKSGTAHTVKFAFEYGRSIVNIYLPYTYEKRSELEYSEKSYSARSYEIPWSQTDLECYLIGLYESVPLESNGVPQGKLDL